jgi:hypothetical protein
MENYMMSGYWPTGPSISQCRCNPGYPQASGYQADVIAYADPNDYAFENTMPTPMPSLGFSGFANNGAAYPADIGLPPDAQQQQMLQQFYVVMSMMMSCMMRLLQMQGQQGPGDAMQCNMPGIGQNSRPQFAYGPDGMLQALPPNRRPVYGGREPVSPGEEIPGSSGPVPGQARAAIDWALGEAQKGITERNNQDYISANYSRGKNQAWCVDFISTALERTGGSPWGHLSSVAELRNWGEKNGQFFRPGQGAPRPGDVIIFQKDRSHAGLVTKVENGRVYTVEGNSSDAVKTRSYPIGSGKITGYVRPFMDNTSLARS